MKSEELMVGDWVNFTYAMKKPYYQRIKNIGTALIDTNELYQALPSQFEPIPITSEILEKNGFRAKSYYYELVLEEEKLRIQSDCYLLFVDSLGLHMGGSKVMNIECAFVHELQHALKLCKIDKEIVL